MEEGSKRKRSNSDGEGSGSSGEGARISTLCSVLAYCRQTDRKRERDGEIERKKRQVEKVR